MFKQIVSYLVISSMLLIDVAKAMEDGPEGGTTKTPPIQRSSAKQSSSSDFSPVLEINDSDSTKTSESSGSSPDSSFSNGSENDSSSFSPRVGSLEDGYLLEKLRSSFAAALHTASSSTTNLLDSSSDIKVEGVSSGDLSPRSHESGSVNSDEENNSNGSSSLVNSDETQKVILIYEGSSSSETSPIATSPENDNYVGISSSSATESDEERDGRRGEEQLTRKNKGKEKEIKRDKEDLSSSFDQEEESGLSTRVPTGSNEELIRQIFGFVPEIPATEYNPVSRGFLPPRAINDDEEVGTKTKAERLPLLSSGAKGVDLESNRPDKSNLMKQWLNSLLTQDLDETLSQFSSWVDSLAKDPRVQNKPLINWILELAKEHQQFLGEAYIEKLERFIEQHPNLREITVAEWAITMFNQASTAEEKYEGLAIVPQAQSELFELIKQVIACEMGYRFAMKAIDEMDPKLKAFLAYFQKYKVEEKFTRSQWGLGVLAILTAIGSSIAQGTIFTTGMRAFFDKIELGEYYDGSTPLSNCVVSFTALTSLLDSLPRNWEEFAALGAAGKKSFRSHGARMAWVWHICKSSTIYLLAIPAAWLTVYYFFDREYTNGVKWLEDHPNYPNQKSLIQQSWTYFGLLVPWLAGDALTGAVHQMREVKELAAKKWEKFTGWLEGGFLVELPLLNWVLKHRPLTEPERQRHEFLKTLKDIRKVIFLMDSDAVEEAYRQVYKPLFKGKKSKETDQLNAAEAFSTLSYFIRYLANEAGDQEEDAQQVCLSKTWKERLSAGVGVFFATTASFARYLTYQFVMRALFSAMGVESELALEVLSNTGAIVGFFIQGLTEEMSMEENIDGMLNKKVHSRTSHPMARLVTNIISALLGVYYTLPYLVTGWVAMEDYPIAAQALCLTPYIIADSHSNGWFFKGTIGAYPHMYDRVKTKFFGKCCGGVNPDYKRDKMIKCIDRLSDLAREADPQVLVDLNQMLEKFDQTTFQNNNMKFREESKESGSPSTPRRKGNSKAKNSLQGARRESPSDSLRKEISDLEKRGSVNADADDCDGEGSVRELEEWVILKSPGGASGTHKGGELLTP